MSCFRPCLHLVSSILLVVLALAMPARAEVTATDILGRQVTLEQPARRIVLAEGRHMAILGILHDDPVSLVVGWRLARSLDEPTMQAYREKFPAIDQIRPVGAGNRDLSVEAVIALKPDLVVISPVERGNPAADRAAATLEAAGIPLAYVDFYTNPLENTVPSLRILGKLTGAEDRAEAFIGFYQSRLDRIAERLKDPAIPRPRVFFHVHAAPSGCCSTVGKGIFDDFIRAAGGQNIGAETIDAPTGTVGLEHLISADPDVYVATGGIHMIVRGGLVLGAGVDQETAQASFDKLVGARGFSGLRAVRDGRAVGVWQMFNDSPTHIALIEFLAKTLHPDLFADLDPDATEAELSQKFSPVQVPGMWWVTKKH